MTINDMWELYIKTMKLEDVSEIQYQETKRAFYAAAYSILMGFQAMGGDDNLSEDQCVDVLESWKQECLRHKDMVEAGLA